MRVVRVISYEGNPNWIQRVLRFVEPHREGGVVFDKHGTIKELQRIVLHDDERLRVIVEREEGHAKGTPD